MTASPIQDNTIWFRLDLLEPVIASQHRSTVGGFAAIDFIPGRVLLGLAAAKLYRKFIKNNALKTSAWDAFHSGKIRYMDGRLFHEESGQLARTVPLSFHTEKGARDAGVWHNFAEERPQSDKQFNQLRDGYFIELPSGKLVKLSVDIAHYFKTSIDPRSGSRPLDGQLFRAEAIARGQSFVAALNFDDDINPALVEQIASAICGTHQLGRSKSAEFGTTRITRLSQPPPGHARRPDRTSLAAKTNAVVYLSSDLALNDPATGLPRLVPNAADFGLPADWSFDAANSFLRFRQYDRFNAHQYGYEPRLEVISRGSVLQFKGSSPLSDAQVDAVLARHARGAGIARQEGLGAFEISPQWLKTHNYSFLKQKDYLAKIAAERRRLQPDALSPVEHPDLPASAQTLLDFVRERVPKTLNTAENQQVDQLLEQLRALYEQSTDRFNPASHNQPPSASQWANVRAWALAQTPDAAFNQAARDQLHTQMQSAQHSFTKNSEPLFTKGWQVRIGANQKPLGNWIIDAISNNQTLKQRPAMALAELAHRARRLALRIQDQAAV